MDTDQAARLLDTLDAMYYRVRWKLDRQRAPEMVLADFQYHMTAAHWDVALAALRKMERYMADTPRINGIEVVVREDVPWPVVVRRSEGK